jgi:hypothetical protein
MKKKQPYQKHEITLMTLLAHESPRESANLLRKYGKQKAKNHFDLEEKLSELYFSCDDKITLEKQLAEIHPHKKWFLEKYPADVTKQDSEAKEDKTENEMQKETKDLIMENSCPHCNVLPGQNVITSSHVLPPHSAYPGFHPLHPGYSSFDANPTTRPVEQPKPDKTVDFAGMATIILAAGITFYALNSLNKR